MPAKRIDPVCGMPGTIEHAGCYFCSESCIEKYKAGKRGKWYREKIFIVSFVIAAVMAVSFFVPFLRPLFNAFLDYLNLIWWAILLGLLLGGLIDHFVPRQYISRMLSRKKKRTIVYATVFGFFLSACSHGILAIAIELYKKGASVPAVIAFLLAAPWANLTITIMLFGFFGVKALFLVISAIVIAIVTGLVYQLLDKRNMIEKSKSSEVDEGFSMALDAKKRLASYRFKVSDVYSVLRGSWALAKMVLWWILIGMFLASLAQAFVPVEFFNQYLGATVLGLLATLALATVIEVCSEGSSPMAFEIFRQTRAFGNSFVFLMAGVATDYTEIGLIWSNIGKRSALWLPVVTVPQILVLGYIFNFLV